MMWIEKQYDEGDDQKYKTWQIDIWLFFTKKLFWEQP